MALSYLSLMAQDHVSQMHQALETQGRGRKLEYWAPNLAYSWIRLALLGSF